jgi:hypothetical protein
MVLDNLDDYKEKWLSLVDKVMGELYTIDEHW